MILPLLVKRDSDMLVYVVGIELPSPHTYSINLDNSFFVFFPVSSCNFILELKCNNKEK